MLSSASNLPSVDIPQLISTLNLVRGAFMSIELYQMYKETTSARFWQQMEQFLGLQRSLTYKLCVI